MKIIALGDSFTEGFLVEKNYTDYLADAGHELVNLGINGNRTYQMLERFIPEKSDVLIVFGGSNDYFDSSSPENTFENVKEIVGKSKSDRNIVVIPPYMEEMEEYPRYQLINNAIDDYGKMLTSLDVDIVDARDIEPSYFIDGLHMREDFHQRLAEEILKIL